MKSYNKIKIRLYFEIAISLFALPYFFLNMIAPFHFFDFFGGAIVSASLTYGIILAIKVLKFIKANPNFKIKELNKKQRNTFMFWYIAPTFIGVNCINYADYLTWDKYHWNDFVNDFVAVTVLSIVVLLLDYFTNREKSHDYQN